MIINPFVFGSAFSPADVPGLYQWLDASQLSLSDNDAVSSWTDESGNGRHATQGTGANQPTFKTGIVNGLSVIRFDGTNDFLSLGNLSALTEGEVFVVFKLDADPGTNSGGLMFLGTAAADNHTPLSDGTVYDGNMSTARKTVGNPVADMSTTFRVLNIWSAANDWAWNLDGSAVHTTATNTVGLSATAELGRSSNLYPLDGDIAEYILYDNKLSGGDRTLVTAYLETKYGL